MLNTTTPQFRMNLMIDIQKINNAIDFIASIKGLGDKGETMHIRLKADTFRRNAMSLVAGNGLGDHMTDVTLRNLSGAATALYRQFTAKQEDYETKPEFKVNEDTLANLNAHRFTIGCIAKHYS
jgi:hypothetical protein